MQPVAHILEFYRTKLAWGDAADWPHIHLRERVRHYEILNGRYTLRDEDAANKLLELGELAIIPTDTELSKLKLASTTKTVGLTRKAHQQADLEDLIDKHHRLRESLRDYVLKAIDEFAFRELDKREQGWRDSDLPRLFKAVDAHLDTLLKRQGIDQ